MLLSLCCQILGCLTNPSCDYAEELLVMFCKHFSQLYGEDQIIYNVHCLIHLANDVRTFGPLQRFSSFPFENHLQSRKRLIRNSRYPLEQVIRRLYEKSQVAKKAKKLTKVVKKRHHNGPLPICKQYEAIEDGNYYVSIHQGDSGVLVDEDIFVVRNIVVVNEVAGIICQKFHFKESFFQYPLDSVQVHILQLCTSWVIIYSTSGK